MKDDKRNGAQTLSYKLALQTVFVTEVAPETAGHVNATCVDYKYTVLSEEAYLLEHLDLDLITVYEHLDSHFLHSVLDTFEHLQSNKGLRAHSTNWGCQHGAVPSSACMTCLSTIGNSFRTG